MHRWRLLESWIGVINSVREYIKRREKTRMVGFYESKMGERLHSLQAQFNIFEAGR